MGVFGQVGGGWVSFLLGGEPTGDDPSWMLHCQAKLPRSPSYHINTFSSPKLFRVFWGKSGQWIFKNLWENVLNLECKTLPATCRCPLPLSIKIREGQFKDSSSFNIGNFVVHMRHRILKWWWMIFYPHCCSVRNSSTSLTHQIQLAREVSVATKNNQLTYHKNIVVNVTDVLNVAFIWRSLN